MNSIKTLMMIFVFFCSIAVQAHVGTEETRMMGLDDPKVQNMSHGRAVYGLQNTYSTAYNYDSANEIKPSAVSETDTVRTRPYEGFQKRDMRELMGATPQGRTPDLQKLVPRLSVKRIK